MTSPVDYPYEASDEASESELLDKSLSMWRGWGPLENEATFDPIPLDLHTAASIGQYDSVSAMIASGQVDIDKRNKGSWTPLMYASYIGHDNIVNLLLDAGAKVDIKSEKGTTALMLTASCGNESVAYFLIQQGAEIEVQDNRGWNTLFYATFAGHQKMVQFLMETGANVNAKEPRHKITPLMMAAAEGHEIIVNAFLQCEGIDVNAKSEHGETARSLALINGHMKIVSLIDTRCMSPSSLRSEAGLGALGPDADLSSSDESYHRPNRPHGRSSRSKAKGPSLRDGPEAIAKLMGDRKGSKPQGPATLSSPIVPMVYVGFQGGDSSPGGAVRSRDVTSPINSAEHDADSYTSRSDSSWQDHYQRSDGENLEDNAFCVSGALTIKSSGSSSCGSSTGSRGGILSLSRENSLSSLDDPPTNKPRRSPSQSPKPEPREVKFSPDIIERAESPVQIQPTGPGRGSYDNAQGAMNYGIDARTHGIGAQNSGKSLQQPLPIYNAGIGYHPSVAPLSAEIGLDNLVDAAVAERSRIYPYHELKNLLESLNLEKYYLKFEEQDVDLRVFLTLTDADLKEVGIKLLGPRRKMTNAIARWHSQARPLSDNLEQAYADRMETAMQEMAEQLSESNFKSEQLEQKVLQERELRSVVEGCLMEDRRTYQQLHSLVSETRQMCHNMRKIYDTVRSCQAELVSRMEQQETPESPTPVSELGLENLARNLHSQLQLDAMLGSGEGNQPIRIVVPTSEASSHMKDQLSLDRQVSSPGANEGDLGHMSMADLKSMLSQYSHQLGRSVAMATNNMDQLIDGQNPGFSPNSSGNSLP
ncbi:ankyrin repeat and SAM domain-containing protein 3-like [Amphiura filiformis]|uniref:ankyrin repeat and SAM domain-containing protein 3-like n=1 Tax=Amphiura filiformis TaxID=82378 RepID=UPI003B213AFF